MNIQDIKLKITELEEVMKNTKQDILNLRCQLLELKTGFKVGQLVENAKGERGILALPSIGDFMDWHWHKLKKNGEPRADKQWIRGKFKVVE